MTQPAHSLDRAVSGYVVHEPRAGYPLEPKVRASAGLGAGAAAVVTPFLLRLIDDLWYGGGELSVPVEYVGIVGFVVVGLSALAAGWFAPHVERIQSRSLG